MFSVFVTGCHSIISQCLGNVLMFYSQFSNVVEKTIQQLTSPVEKEFNVRKSLSIPLASTPSLINFIRTMFQFFDGMTAITGQSNLLPQKAVEQF